MLLDGAHDAVAAGVEGWVTEARLVRTDDAPCNYF